MNSFTFLHIFYFILITGITIFFVRSFLRFKLLKWIYFGVLIVSAANLYKGGNKKEAAVDIFKLATI